MRVTLISDTHTKHNRLVHSKTLRNNNESFHLPGGNLLIHAGDFMSSGYNFFEADEFFKWFDEIDNYDTKVLIAGNHDRVMEYDSKFMLNHLSGFKTIEYLQDEELVLYFDGPDGDYSEDNVRIYGSPWQPEFFNWAFNLPRNGEEMKAKWDAIPNNTDILITHSPPYGRLDIPGRQNIRVGCEMLRHRVDEISPKIHVFGHIHGGYGYYFDGHTHFFNASVLDENYLYTQHPWNFDWDKNSNEIKFNEIV